MADTTKMTAAAHQQLEADIAALEGEGRREVAARIGVAREWGDLKENAEYHAAKDEAAMLEARIARMRDQLRSAEIVEPAAKGAGAGMGSTVTYVDESAGREHTYRLVSGREADPGGRLDLDRLASRQGAGWCQGRRPTGARDSAGGALAADPGRRVARETRSECA